MNEARGENPEIVELDELGENEGNFGTRMARDAEEGAEFTRRFTDFGVAGACDFCHRFRHRGHAPPTQRTHVMAVTTVRSSTNQHRNEYCQKQRVQADTEFC